MTRLMHLGPVDVRQDEHDRFDLNALHRASGSHRSFAPNFFMRLEQTKRLIELLEAEGTDSNAAQSCIKPVAARRGRHGGTYVVRELVYAYAMWINPEFYLRVIRTFDADQRQHQSLGAKRHEIDKRLEATKPIGSLGGRLMQQHKVRLRSIEREYADLRALVQLTLFPDPESVKIAH